MIFASNATNQDIGLQSVPTIQTKTSSASDATSLVTKKLIAAHAWMNAKKKTEEEGTSVTNGVADLLVHQDLQDHIAATLQGQIDRTAVLTVQDTPLATLQA